jgi:FkbM family methyltransferase
VGFLSEKADDFRSGRIEKHRYMEEMYEVHKHLFEYPALVKGCAIERIEISGDEVTFVFAGDLKICCDPRDAYSIPLSFLNLAEFETEENAMIYRLVNPGDVVFDVGANIGWYTINILLRKPGARVYAFEPIDSSFELLKRNLRRNGLDAERCHRIGLSDRSGSAQFYFDIECATASSMANLRDDERTVVVECPIRTMDEFAAGPPSLDRLDFIKCDVEGGELLVFRGGLETIRKHRPIVFSEMLRKWAKKFGYHPNDIIDLFRGIGYRCYVIVGEGIREFGRVDDETLETNYLFFHGEKHAEVVSRLTATG